jgi:hypothetical protein
MSWVVSSQTIVVFQTSPITTFTGSAECSFCGGLGHLITNCKSCIFDFYIGSSTHLCIFNTGPKLETQRRQARSTQMSLHGGGANERD